MAFKMNRSKNDEKLFQKETENIFTLGRGSYTAPFNITLSYQPDEKNILGGRFCSLAHGILFLVGGNHSMKSVSSCPFDSATFVKSMFGKSHPNVRPVTNKRKQYYQIIFGHDVWIGLGATILGGVKIGTGAVIGARAVVAKDIPPYAIAVGNPARVIKYRFDETTIRKLLAVKWWNWSLEKIADNLPLINDVEKFLETHYSPALEEFPDDEFTQKLNNFAGGGKGFINSLRTSRRKLSCGLKSYKIFARRTWRTRCL